jgi:hypothetical protein
MRTARKLKRMIDLRYQPVIEPVESTHAAPSVNGTSEHGGHS